MKYEQIDQILSGLFDKMTALTGLWTSSKNIGINLIKLTVIGLVVLPMVIPLPSAEAQSMQTQPIQVAQLTVAGPDIISVSQPSLTIEKTESVYEKDQKKVLAQIALEKSQVKVAKPEFDVDKRKLVQDAAAAYGIDWRVLEAVWQVESGKQLYTSVRSYAGAQGPFQFMPGTWRGYAKDGNGDGVKDVYDARDAAYAAADLLARNGAASGNNIKALLAYNHAMWYVNKVLDIAYKL